MHQEEMETIFYYKCSACEKMVEHNNNIGTVFCSTCKIHGFPVQMEPISPETIINREKTIGEKMTDAH